MYMAHWQWGFLAAGLVIMEIIVPKSFFVWLGLAAGIVSGVHFLFLSLGWMVAASGFAGISALAVTLSRVPWRARPFHPPWLGRYASQYIGRVFVLPGPIQGGVGQLELDGALWTIVGCDTRAGRKVKVVGFEEAVLAVEEVEV